jgi:hypothetical protein
MPRKYHTRSLNQITLPLSVQHELWADRVQDEVNRLLENDRLFGQNHRALRNALTSGLISSGTFNAIRAWQIGDAVRRAGLPLVVTRAYLRLAPKGCV